MRNKAQIIKWILAVIVVTVILYITVFCRSIGTEHIFRLLFWELKNGYWKDIGLNILLFVPFGVVIGGRKGILAGFILSFIIEVIQYVFCLGYCEMDDVLNNTIGVLIGALINKIATRNVEKLRKKL